MTPVTVGTAVAGEDHPADLRLVARVPYHRSELGDSMGELAMGTVRTRACLLPLVAELRLEHPLIVHFQLESGEGFIVIVFLSCGCGGWNVHSLLYARCRGSNPSGIELKS